MPEITSRLSTALADRYAIEREIGAGGMATVYLAEDVKHKRKVAVKVLRPELAAVLGAERFLREIRIAAQLQHPHILPLHDSGEAGGLLYYVMPYVLGESLADRLDREGELPIEDAVQVLREVADALAYAHQQGVVHRDVKPDNVMIADGHALVTDFGVAKAVSEAAGEERLTTAGMAIGTPAYMAPEQAAGDPTLDHRVDIYAIGILGYQLLTGTPPFRDRTPQQLLAAHLTETPEPLTQVRSSIPDSLANIVMRCLEKRPADRWQKAEDIVRELTAVPLASRAGLPTIRRSDPPPARRAVPSRGSLRSIVTAIMVVAAFLAGYLIRGGGSMETRTFTVRHLDPDVLLDALAPFIDDTHIDAGDRVTMIGPTLSVRETPENLDRIDELLAQIDVPQPILRLTTMLVRGVDSADRNPQLEELEGALAAALPFPAYELFAQSTVSGKLRAVNFLVMGQDTAFFEVQTTALEIVDVDGKQTVRTAITINLTSGPNVFATTSEFPLDTWVVPGSFEGLILALRMSFDP